MNDYISRETAKNALRAQRHRLTVADEASGCGYVKWSEDVIYAEIAEKTIDELPTAEVQPVRWIPVEEQMPEMHDAGILKMLGIQQMSEKVLLAILNEEEAIVDNDAELRDGEWYSDTLRFLKAGGKAFTVTHWMPLPELPSVNGKETEHDPEREG